MSQNIQKIKENPYAKPMHRTVVLDLVRVTEAAARAAIKHLGRGDKNVADGAAVEAMRFMLNTMHFNGSVAIGEGAKDDAPELYEGEVLGTAEGREFGPELEIAVDPIDGTTIVSKGSENAISVIALAEKGAFFRAPDLYRMQKLVVGPRMNIEAFDLDMPAEEAVRLAAEQKGVNAEDIVVCMLDRKRNQKFIDGVRAAGGRVKLISDGDVAGALATCLSGSGVDMLMGYGGAPEGVITAAALKCLGGGMLGRMTFPDDRDAPSFEEAGLSPDKIYRENDLAKGHVMFAASGITDGTLLKGIHRHQNTYTVHSVVMRSETGTVRWIETQYQDNL